LEILGWSAFGLAVFVGVVLNLVGLFGNWVILAAVAGAYVASGFEYFGWGALLMLLALAVLGEVLETLAAGVGAAKFGGGKGAITGALVGCLAGAVLGTGVIPIPIVGTLIGACGGAFLGAALYEHLMRDKNVGDAMYVGTGAALGKIGGLLLKSFVGFTMLGVAAWQF
jgi:uncharacterized protein YqgC (DUF456 family)